MKGLGCGIIAASGYYTNFMPSLLPGFAGNRKGWHIIPHRCADVV